jgi:hypothetical protein
MHGSVARWSVIVMLVAVAGCGGDASAASSPDLTAHFEPPRSLGTPLAEVQRVSGRPVSKEKVNRDKR